MINIPARMSMFIQLQQQFFISLFIILSYLSTLPVKYHFLLSANKVTFVFAVRKHQQESIGARTI